MGSRFGHFFQTLLRTRRFNLPRPSIRKHLPAHLPTLLILKDMGARAMFFLEEDEDKEMTVTTVPDRFICPITLTIMNDPVKDSAGNNFEREAIYGWIFRGNRVCPLTRRSIEVSEFVSNTELKEQIRRWRTSSSRQVTTTITHCHDDRDNALLDSEAPYHHRCPPFSSEQATESADDSSSSSSSSMSAPRLPMDRPCLTDLLANITSTNRRVGGDEEHIVQERLVQLQDRMAAWHAERNRANVIMQLALDEINRIEEDDDHDNDFDFFMPL